VACAGGRNLDGELGASRHAGTSNINRVPVQIIGYAGAGHGHEVIAVSSGGSHVVALATPDGRTDRHVPRRTLVWGDNSMGQIGAPETAEARAVMPRRLLRSLFPHSDKGNVIDDTNRRVCYKRWDAGVVSHYLELATGVRGIKDIEGDINTQMGGQYISITTDEESERVSFHLRGNGVQFDFFSDNCRALSDRLGFSRGFEIPATGLANEVRTTCRQSRSAVPCALPSLRVRVRPVTHQPKKSMCCLSGPRRRCVIWKQLLACPV